MRRLRLRHALLVSAAVIALVGPAGRTAVAATDVLMCTFGSSAGTVKTCLHMTGSGLFVQSARPSAAVLSGSRMIDEELVGPSVDLHSGFEFVPAGTALVEPDWCPDRDVAAGNYSAITRQRNGDGTISTIGRATVTVPL